MDTNDIFSFGLFGLAGVLTTIMGILIWTGYTKAWFIIERIPVVVPTAFYNGSLAFAGLSITFIGVGLLIEETDLFLWLGCFLMILTLILAVWQPRWIQPAWYRWLEENHRAIIPILKKEVQQMGVRQWQRQVSTQAGLEEWVEEVRRQRGLRRK